eukprot:19183-Heterococcus_DN1.PRE.9
MCAARRNTHYRAFTRPTTPAAAAVSLQSCPRRSATVCTVQYTTCMISIAMQIPCRTMQCREQVCLPSASCALVCALPLRMLLLSVSSASALLLAVHGDHGSEVQAQTTCAIERRLLVQTLTLHCIWT